MVMSEQQEQILFVEWLRLQPVFRELEIKIDNEGKRQPWQGAIAKRMGLHPGASDLFIAKPTHDYHGLWIEMKRRKRYTITPSQIRFCTVMRKQGYAAYICRGFDEARTVTERYLAGALLNYDDYVKIAED